MRSAVRSISPSSMFLARVGLCAALGAFAACTPGPTAEKPPVPVVVPVPAVATCAPGVRAEGCPEPAPSAEAATPPACADAGAGPRCEGILAPDEATALGTAIDAARKAILDSKYSDVHAMVEAARLQLRRDADLPDPEAQTDARRALNNAMRAVAVDDAAPAPRLVMALSRARSLAGSKVLTDATTRRSGLDLVEIALRSIPASAGATGAAAKTLEGYVALERGNRAAAKAAFESATKLDPALGSAWMGLGDAARAEGAFDAATAAYKTAAARLPADAGVRRAAEAASRREGLSLPAAATIALNVAWGPLAPAAPPLPKCPASAKATSPGAALCTGLTDLAKATTRDDQERGAKRILDGWAELQPLCEKRDPVCGPHVAEAIAAASRAFHSAGRLSKSVAVGLVLFGHGDLPGATALLPTVALEIGDRYLSLAVVDTASDFYGRHLQLKGKIEGPVALRALALNIALGRVDGASKLAVPLSADASTPVADRASAVLATAALIRATQGPKEAVTWLAPHKDLLAQAGMTGAVKELAKPLPAPAAGPECASLLVCAVRRLAGESRWSP